MNRVTGKYLSTQFHTQLWGHHGKDDDDEMLHIYKRLASR